MRPKTIKRIIAVVILLQGCCCIRGIIKDGKFQFPQRGYEVNMIDDQWEHELKKGIINIMFKSKNGDAAIAVFAYEVKPQEKNKSVEAYATQAAMGLKEERYIDEVKTREIQVHGRRAMENLYSGIYKGKDIILKGERYWYVLRYWVTPISFEKYLPEFDKWVDSFHMVGEPQ